MLKPDFSIVGRRAQPRSPLFQQNQPNAIPPDQRIFTCECCNDSGVVQSWKLAKFATDAFGDRLDAIMSAPVFCHLFDTCGSYKTQVFEDHHQKKFSDQDTERVAERSLFHKADDRGGSGRFNTTIGEAVATRKAVYLTPEQSRYIHDSVLAYRATLANTEHGRQWVEQVKEAARNAAPANTTTRTPGKLTPIGAICIPFQMPAEPDWNEPRNEPPVVQAGPDPRDLAADPQPSVFPGQSPLRTQEQADPVVRDPDHQPRQEPSGSRCDMESPF